MTDTTGRLKFLLVIFAVLIAVLSLLTSNFLMRDLQKEESNDVEVWAEAMRTLNTADESTDLNLVLKVINGNNTIPVVVLDKRGNVQTYRNLNKHFTSADSLQIIKEMAMKMKSYGNVIRIYFDESMMGAGEDEYESSLFEPSKQNDSTSLGMSVSQSDDRQEYEKDYIDICFDESLMLKRLALYPYIQLSVVIIFVLVAIFALFSSMKAEQNKVWVGLSKETAHQLGTPISSLMAWLEVLKETYLDDSLLPEMDKDIKRLERIAERFSKIGSIPEPKPEDVSEILRRTVDYMNHRISNKVVITSHLPAEPVIINLIAPLFEWVAENLCKNAVDAMDGSGRIDLYVTEIDDLIVIDVKDTGKGIAKSKFKSVFTPGFTTKERGWGLGLSLAKRIVEDYHKGKIYVKSSEIGVGTTFRIELHRSV